MIKHTIFPFLIFILTACTQASFPEIVTPTLANNHEESPSLQDAISTLKNQLQANEADAFAGLWLQHEPEYRVIVAFTRNGEKTIQ